MIINVPECDWRPKAEFIGGSSDNIAVLAVQVANILNIVPTGPTAQEPKLFKALVMKGMGGGKEDCTSLHAAILGPGNFARGWKYNL